MHDFRTDLAMVVYGAARAEGWPVPPSLGYAIADALIVRPGLLRAVTVAGEPGDRYAADAPETPPEGV